MWCLGWLAGAGVVWGLILLVLLACVVMSVPFFLAFIQMGKMGKGGCWSGLGFILIGVEWIVVMFLTWNFAWAVIGVLLGASPY